MLIYDAPMCVTICKYDNILKENVHCSDVLSKIWLIIRVLIKILLIITALIIKMVYIMTII